MDKKWPIGLVLGKFLPPHKGHQFLLDVAQSRVERLFIVVDNISDDVIPVSLRMAWVQQMMPEATVLTLPQSLPQRPEDCPGEFWGLWEAGLKAVLPEPVDVVFASELYGELLAQVLNARFEMVDLARKQVPISATRIRQNPLENWDFIAEAARPFYCKKVCIFGPESVGKSTLTAQLATHYKTQFVPEYARTLIENQEGEVHYADMERIAMGHRDAIQLGLSKANRVLFVDTDAITTKIWSRELFGCYPARLDAMIAESEFDLYLLLNVDVPWVPDTVRYRPEERERFFETCRTELERYGRTHVVLSGDWKERFEQATRAVDALLNPFDEIGVP